MCPYTSLLGYGGYWARSLISVGPGPRCTSENSVKAKFAGFTFYEVG
jgi:hypothetical protein